MKATTGTGVWFVALALAAGCNEIADYDEFPGQPDDELRDLGEDSDSGSDPGETDAGDVDTEAPDVDPDSEADTGPELPDGGSTWCKMVAPAGGGKLAVIQVDMDSGLWGELGTYGGESSGITESYHTAGIGLLDGVMVMSGYTGNDFNWIALDTEADAVTKGAISDYTVSVASDGTRLVTICSDSGDEPFPSGFCFYDSFETLNAGTPDDFVYSSTGDTRLCATAERVYTAWHSTDEVDVYDIDSGAHLATIALEGWDEWVWGMSVAGGALHLTSGGFGGRIAKFDPETGELLGEVYIDATEFSHPPTGLWCGVY